MQSKQVFHFLFLLFTCSNCVYAQQNDSTTIVQLLKADYATMGNNDTLAHLHNITSDYLLIEKGDVWDIQTELDSIYRNSTGQAFTRTDFFTFKTVKASGNMAYAVWHLKSEIRENGNLRIKQWNESGVFRKEDGIWKIALIHSTIERQK